MGRKCNCMNPCKRQAEGDFISRHTEEKGICRWSRERFEDTDFEDSGDAAISRGILRAARSGRRQGMDSPLELWIGCSSAKHLYFPTVTLTLDFWLL